MISSHDWKPERLAIGAVKEREALQMRHGPLAQLHVKALARAMEAKGGVEPIRVAKIGKALCVVDGFHRLAAARSLGQEAIEALVAPMSMEDAEAFARTANVGHGRNLGRHDKQKSWESYLKASGHLSGGGVLKSCRAISVELGGMYSHETVMAKLRKAGITPNKDLDAAEGSKWSGRYSDGAEGEDIDNLGENGVGPLDTAGAAKALEHLEAIVPLYFGLGEQHRLAIRRAVRELLDRLMANVEPAVPEVPWLDI